MKTKISKKLIVSTLSTAMGVSLVGAITGTVAWYQYSTRSTVSFVGTTIRNSENLQVAFAENGDFVNDLSQTDIAGQVVNTQLLPITTGAQAKNANLKLDDNSKPIFYANPIYQKFGYNEWLRADASAYVQFTVYLKLNKVVNNDPAVIIEAPRKVYLGDFLIQDDRQNDLADISDAIRVHLHSDHEDMLLGKTNDNTNVFGALDLNLDNRNDTEEVIYSFTDMNNVTEGVYGTQDAVQGKYKFNDVKPGVDAEGLLTGDHYLGTLFSKEVIFAQQAAQFEANVDYYEEDTLENITADQAPVLNKKYYVRQDALPVTVTIWLEGWHKLEDIKKVQLPAGYNLDGLEYFTDADLAPDHKVAAGTKANGTTEYFVSDGNGGSQAVTPINGQYLNDGKVYFTDIKLNNQASGNVDATADYYYSNGQSAMWDALRYVGAKFDVGLMFEVDA